MMTPRSSASSSTGSCLLICHAASRLMLKEPMRLRSTVLRKESRLCGPSFLIGPLADAAARGGHDDVQSAEPVDRLLQHLLCACEVGDVHLVEGAADRRRPPPGRFDCGRSSTATLAPR